jgi:hypothetical protein
VALLEPPDLIVTVRLKRSVSKQASLGSLAVEAVPVDDETKLHGGGGRGKWW